VKTGRQQRYTYSQSFTRLLLLPTFYHQKPRQLLASASFSHIVSFLEDHSDEEQSDDDIEDPAPLRAAASFSLIVSTVLVDADREREKNEDIGLARRLQEERDEAQRYHCCRNRPCSCGGRLTR
jgi:hypothetical protein